jgi:dTMP kinase
LGEKLRDLLLHPGNDPVPLAELFMLEAARAQLAQCVIAPAIAAGSYVLADRYADSSLAYQGGARGVAWETVEHLNAEACGGLIPDRTLVLELPVGQALRRARTRTSTTAENRRFEDEALAFHAKVADGYRRLARAHPDRVRIVDADGQRGDVHARVISQLGDLLS